MSVCLKIVLGIKRFGQRIHHLTMMVGDPVIMLERAAAMPPNARGKAGMSVDYRTCRGHEAFRRCPVAWRTTPARPPKTQRQWRRDRARPSLGPAWHKLMTHAGQLSQSAQQALRSDKPCAKAAAICECDECRATGAVAMETTSPSRLLNGASTRDTAFAPRKHRSPVICPPQCATGPKTAPITGLAVLSPPRAHAAILRADAVCPPAAGGARGPCASIR